MYLTVMSRPAPAVAGPGREGAQIIFYSSKKMATILGDTLDGNGLRAGIDRNNLRRRFFAIFAG